MILNRIKRSQFSMEYLLTVVIIIALFIPVLFIGYNSMVGETEQTKKQQLETLGNFFLENVEKVYNIGVPARITAQQRVPTPLENITAGGYNNQDIIFILPDKTNFSFSTYYPINVNLNRPLQEGIITVRFDSVYLDGEQMVNITILD
ncbi:MAG: hypothetical protein PWQ28_634 [Candidatus Woesearchaeota archaeon]|nr:hypothetical protein [Candidatus Woesearchaeota archaeon]